jgi:hypothetical protein
MLEQPIKPGNENAVIERLDFTARIIFSLEKGWSVDELKDLLKQNIKCSRCDAFVLGTDSFIQGKSSFHFRCPKCRETWLEW